MMKKLFLMLSVFCLAGISVVKAQGASHNVVNLDNYSVYSGDEFCVFRMSDENPISVSWTKVSGNFTFGKTGEASAVLLGSGMFKLVYRAVYPSGSSIIINMSGVITAKPSGGGGGNGSGNNPLPPAEFELAPCW